MAFSGSVIIFAMSVLSVSCASISARSTIRYDLHSAIQEWTTWNCTFPDTKMYTAQSGQELKHLHLDSNNRELDECGLLNLQESQSWTPKEKYLYKVCEAIFQGSMTLCRSTDENAKNFVNTALTPHALANAVEYTEQKNVCFYASSWPDHIKENFSFMNSRSDCEEFCLNLTEGIKKVCELLVSFACQLANREDGYIKCLPSPPDSDRINEANVGNQPKDEGNVGNQPKEGNEGNQPKDDGNVGNQPEDKGNVGNQPKDDGNVGNQPKDGGNVGNQPKDEGNVGNQPKDEGNVGNQPKDDGNVGNQPKDDGNEGNQPKDEGNVGNQPKDEGNVGNQPKDDGNVGNQPKDRGNVGNQPKDDGNVGNQPKDEGNVGNQPKDEGNVGNQPKDEGNVGNQPKDDGNEGNQPKDDGNVGNQPKDEINVGNQPKDKGNVGNQPKDDGNVGNQPKDEVDVGNQPKDDGNVGNQPKDEGNVGNQPKDDGNVENQPKDEGNVGNQPKDEGNVGNQQPDDENQQGADSNGQWSTTYSSVLGDSVDPGNVESKTVAASSADETEKLANENNEVQEKPDSHGRAEESAGSGHILAYFLTAVVLCISGYVIYHNKQKIMAFIIEGRTAKRGGRQRSNEVKYTQLKSNVEEVMPSLEKSTTGKNFVY